MADTSAKLAGQPNSDTGLSQIVGKLDVQINDGVIWPPTAKLRGANGVSVPVAEFLLLSFSHHMEILSGAKTLEERAKKAYREAEAANSWPAPVAGFTLTREKAREKEMQLEK